MEQAPPQVKTNSTAISLPETNPSLLNGSERELMPVVPNSAQENIHIFIFKKWYSLY